jgi:hypothetical protein
MVARCLIWGTVINTLPPTAGDYAIVDSPRAGGRYQISGSASAEIQANEARFNEHVKARLTTWIIDQGLLGELPEISTNTLNVVEQRKNLLPQQRADRLLRYFSRRSEHIGDEVRFDLGTSMYLGSNDAMLLAWSESSHATEVEFLTGYLEERRWVRIIWNKAGKDPAGTAVITPEGYARLAELDQKTVVSSQAFVAMWFSDATNGAYSEGVEPAIRDAGYRSLRIDRKEHVNKIDMRSLRR